MIHEYEQSDGISCVTMNPDETLVNVVFVHGLGGGAFTTWNSGDLSELGFWPKSIAIDHPRCCVWTVHYTARILEKPFSKSSSMDLLDRAAWLTELMVLKQIPAKPIVFVTHSLGGIVVKQLLQFAQYLGPPQWRPIWEQTQAVLFLATPHVGSGLADIAISLTNLVKQSNYISSLFLRESSALSNLKKDSPILRYLGDWYRDRAPVQGIETIAFAEGKKSIGGMMIVSESSANPQITNVRAMPIPSDDHISIAKPKDKNHPVYLSLNKCLKTIEKRAMTSVARWTPSQSPVDQVTVARLAENRKLIKLITGAWWELVTRESENGNTISFMKIQPDMLFNSVWIDGDSYNNNGDKVADWTSVIAKFEKSNNKIIINYLWKGKHTASRIANIQFHGFGTLEFDMPSNFNDSIVSGSGTFWDVNESHPEKTILKPIELRRISRHGHQDDPVGTMSKGNTFEIQSLVKETITNWQNPKNLILNE